MVVCQPQCCGVWRRLPQERDQTLTERVMLSGFVSLGKVPVLPVGIEHKS